MWLCFQFVYFFKQYLFNNIFTYKVSKVAKQKCIHFKQKLLIMIQLQKLKQPLFLQKSGTQDIFESYINIRSPGLTEILLTMLQSNKTSIKLVKDTFQRITKQTIACAFYLCSSFRHLKFSLFEALLVLLQFYHGHFRSLNSEDICWMY